MPAPKKTSCPATPLPPTSSINPVTTTAGSAPVKKKIPAIFAYTRTTSPSAIANFLREDKVLAEMTLRNGRITILPRSQLDHAKIWSFVTETGIQAHTNSPEAPSFPRKWVVRGISSSIDPADVADDIRQQIGCTCDVQRMTRRDAGGAVRAGADLFSVLVPTAEDARRLREIRVVFHHRVTWEAPHRPDLVQCYRCQRFGHTAKHCNFQRRCVKCPETHEPGSCTRDGDLPPYCVNCGEEGHPANYRGCPVRIAKVEHLAHQREAKTAAAAASKKAPPAPPRPLTSSARGQESSRIAAQTAPMDRSGPGSGQRNQSQTPEEARPENKACWGMVGRFEEDLKSFEKNGGNKSDPAWKDLFMYMIFARHRLSSM